MTCPTNRISCQLEAIAQELNRFDLGAFVSTLIATILGATLALLGAWWLEKLRIERESQTRALQRSQEDNYRYETRLDDAIYRLIERIGLRREMLATIDAQALPPQSSLAASLDVARMAAREDDAKALKQMQYAIQRIESLPAERQAKWLGTASQITRAWREDAHDAALAAERFRGLVDMT